MVTVSDGTGRSAHCLNGDGLIVVAPTVPEGITVGCSPLWYALPNVTPLLFLVVFLCRLQIHEEFPGVTSSSFFRGGRNSLQPVLQWSMMYSILPPGVVFSRIWALRQVSSSSGGM